MQIFSDVQWLTLGGIALAVAGVVSTVYFGLQTRRRVELSFFIVNSISLFEEAIADLSDLQVLFKNEPITDQCFLYQAVVVNTGTADIDQADCYSPTTLELPQGFSWTDSTRVTGAKGVSIDADTEGGSLKVKWDLLKAGEHIAIDALVIGFSDASGDSAETSSGSLRRKTRLRHRIKDLKSVKQFSNLPRRFNWGSVFSSIFLAVMVSMLIYMSAQKIFEPLLRPPSEVIYSVTIEDGREEGKLALPGFVWVD